MITIAAVAVLAVLAAVSLLLAPELAADDAWIRWRLAALVLIIPARGLVGPDARRTPDRVESGTAAGGAPGADRARASAPAPGAVPLSGGRHASTTAIRCGGRVTERTVPRKPTFDLPPWDIDTTSFPAVAERVHAS
jgi:hypothetical protein